MWGKTKKKIKELEERIDFLDKEREHDCRILYSNDSNVDVLKAKMEGIVTCEICGCLINKKVAIKGKPFIKTYENMFSITIEKIYHPYYCKMHKPAEGGE